MRASEIEEVLRTDVAEPSPAFAAELDRRVAEGFPKPARRRRAWLRPAIAGAAVLIGVAVVAVSLVGNGGPRRSAPVPLSRDGAAAQPAHEPAPLSALSSVQPFSSTVEARRV